MSEYLQIKYRNSCDLGGTVFQQPQTAFHYVIYFDVDPGKPTFELIDEGREDGEKNFISDFKKLTKRYEFTTAIPEYQFDALCSVMIHDTIFIRLKNGERSRVFGFTVTPVGWNENGNMITVTVSYYTVYNISTGCCNNEKIVYTPCLVCNSKITPSDWVDINTQQTTQYADRVWLMMGIPDISTGEYSLNRLYQYRYTRPIQRPEFVTPAPIGGYQEYIGRTYELICFTHDSVYVRFYYLNGYWRPFGFIRSAILDAGRVTVRAWMHPDSFARLYQSTDGVNYTAVGVPVFAGAMQSVGVTTAALASGTYYFKVLFYNNNCNYGYSTVETVVVP